MHITIIVKNTLLKEKEKVKRKKRKENKRKQHR
jgi:hypothetical protein